jgi:hypothetical protein
MLVLLGITLPLGHELPSVVNLPFNFNKSYRGGEDALWQANDG